MLVRIAPLDESEQIIVPLALRRRVLQMNHEPAAAGHAGGQRTYETMRQGFYWPSMVADVYHTFDSAILAPRIESTRASTRRPWLYFRHVHRWKAWHSTCWDRFPSRREGTSTSS